MTNGDADNDKLFGGKIFGYDSFDHLLRELGKDEPEHETDESETSARRTGKSAPNLELKLKFLVPSTVIFTLREQPKHWQFSKQRS